jgi:trk system potassium uptake protein TrkH
VPQAAAGELPGGEGLGTTWLTRVRAAVFQSITARTAGFNTIDMAELSAAGKLWMCALMTIGGSPASTAGGMKTMVVALLALTAWSSLRGRPAVEAFHRTVSHDLVRKAVTLAVLYLLLVLIVTLLLCVEMRGHDLVDLLFEACSACGTVGLSTGVTANLTFSSKIVIIAAMFVGRLGTLTMLLAFSRRMKPVEYAYPGEDVVIG